MLHNLNSVVKYGVNTDKENTRLQTSVETISNLVPHTWCCLQLGYMYVLSFLSHLDSPDYTLQGETGTIFYTFSPNVSQQCTTIQTLEDNISEPPETLSLSMVVLLDDDLELIDLSPAATNVTIIRK